jgi:hypothetical protein
MARGEMYDYPGSYRVQNYEEASMSKMKHKVPKMLACAFSTLLSIMLATTTLVLMAHGERWGSVRDDLIASPLIVLGFGVALVSFIWAMCMVDA